MKNISFIHLSDIHFRKTSGNFSDIDEDLRRAVLTDINMNAKVQLEHVQGILVGGDIAFCGQEEEYNIARIFLSEITSDLGVDDKNVYCVPGNHDVDQMIIRSSKSIYNAQRELDEAETIDEADKILEGFMFDPASPNLLYKSIEKYNDFAASYSCNINSKKTVWTETFDLDNNLKLKLLGMNSCIISNHDDHKDKTANRLMIIGQSQILSYENDTVLVSLCHHPLDFWKFRPFLQSKLDKRFDIQLYGHKHEQFVDKNNERLVISAGATHPVRGKDWLPRYNWISFKCMYINGDRYLEVKVYPRVLSEDRDRFICDKNNCDDLCDYFIFQLNFDQKRRKNLLDTSDKLLEPIIHSKDDEKIKNLKRKIAYKFFELPYIKQSDILSSMNLLRDEYEGKKYMEVIEFILDEAERLVCLDEFYKLLKEDNRR